MSKDASKADSAKPVDWRTQLIHSTADAPLGFRSLATPTYRGSTVVFENLENAFHGWQPGGPSTYGIYGTPTTLELGARIAALENARHTFIVPSGMAAITLVYLAYSIPPLPPGEGRGEGALECPARAHVLTPETAYGNSFEVAEGLLEPLGIEVEPYDPMIGAGIEKLIRENTSLIWTESPGSITMEVQDVPAIAAAAKEHGVPVALDNTYAAGVLFDAFAAGVDVSMQALTKYVGGHSDLLLGTVSVNREAAMQRVGKTFRLLGLNVSPDDSALALRGLKTLGVRLAHLEKSTLEVAKWLKSRPEISLVLHPALPDCPGHEFWKRDFTGSASVFSIVFSDDWTAERVMRFVDALELFKIGYSWGGVTSLVMAYESLTRSTRNYGRQLVRLNIGLEEPQDLVADLEQAISNAN
jgi:cysteine-S-conjugate beta-lyase